MHLSTQHSNLLYNQSPLTQGSKSLWNAEHQNVFLFGPLSTFNLLSYFPNSKTDGQTNSGGRITSDWHFPACGTILFGGCVNFGSSVSGIAPTDNSGRRVLYVPPKYIAHFCERAPIWLFTALTSGIGQRSQDNLTVALLLYRFLPLATLW